MIKSNVRPADNTVHEIAYNTPASGVNASSLTMKVLNTVALHVSVTETIVILIIRITLTGHSDADDTS